METSFYTRLTYECKYEDFTGPVKIEHSEPVWDCDINKMVEMFHTLMIGATYTEETFKQGLINYLMEHYNINIIDNNII